MYENSLELGVPNWAGPRKIFGVMPSSSVGVLCLDLIVWVFSRKITSCSFWEFLLTNLFFLGGGEDISESLRRSGSSSLSLSDFHVYRVFLCTSGILKHELQPITWPEPYTVVSP